ncbi:Lymphatic vessel endothelial hyaluronic acid receptor 1, partial [Varanus komodoensis]
MASHFGVTLLFFSVWIVGFTIQDTFDLTDIVTSSCRIGGISHVQDRKKRNFDFTEAEAICRQLGLRIATKPEIEHARSHGFETCSFGWVAERYTVISRIVPNTKCGQNKTGVATWRQDAKRKFGVYCFNSS